MHVVIEDVNPERAKTLLERNTGNFRKIDKKRVTLYAKEMQRGEWHVTGDTIKINEDGKLLDGQHRLLAIVGANVTVTCTIAWDVPADALAIDRGKPRTVAQYCRHEGVKNATNIAAAARLCLMHDKNLWDRVTAQIEQITDAEVVDYIHTHMDALQSGMALARKSKHIVPQSTCAAILELGCRPREPSNVTEAVWFVSAVATGTSLEPHDAPLHLRNKLLAQNQRHPLSPFAKRILTTLAWNYTVLGKRCTKQTLKVYLSGPNKQAIPKHVESAEE